MRNAYYHSSQPWPFPSSLMVGFHAVARAWHHVRDGELEDARWFTREDVEGPPPLPPSQSISYRLITTWLRDPSLPHREANAMCLLVLAWRAHPRYRLVVAANRDEFHERPTAPLAKWPEPNDILAGQDLRPAAPGSARPAPSLRRRHQLP